MAPWTCAGTVLLPEPLAALETFAAGLCAASEIPATKRVRSQPLHQPQLSLSLEPDFANPAARLTFFMRVLSLEQNHKRFRHSYSGIPSLEHQAFLSIYTFKGKNRRICSSHCSIRPLKMS